MNRRALAYLPVMLAALVATQPAWAFKCGSRLVREGDRIFEVLEKCGPPIYASRHTEYRDTRFFQYGYTFGEIVPVEIEEWLYDFGRRRFVQRLLFENGVLVNVQSLGLPRY